jgi:hypothetical protein
MAEVRKLSDAEIIALAEKYAGITARCWAKYTEPLLIVDPEDEIRVIEWDYASKVNFLLETAQHDARPN